MTDTSGRSLLSMAEDVSRLTRRYSPGRPAFSNWPPTIVNEPGLDGSLEKRPSANTPRCGS